MKAQMMSGLAVLFSVLVVAFFFEKLSVLLRKRKTAGIKKPAESAGFEILAVRNYRAITLAAEGPLAPLVISNSTR